MKIENGKNDEVVNDVGLNYGLLFSFQIDASIMLVA